MTTGVLILVQHNSARSVLAEAMLNHWAKALNKDIEAHSARSTPSGRVDPLALDVLRSAGIEIKVLCSKGRDEFATAGAPPSRIVITVCDSAAKETCPYWPGSPVRVHWGFQPQVTHREPMPTSATHSRSRARRSATGCFSSHRCRLIPSPMPICRRH